MMKNTTHTKAAMSSSQVLPLVINSNVQHPKKVHSVLPFFCFINMTISCGTTIYRAYNHKDYPMIVFISFVYVGSFLLDYWSKLYQKLPPLPEQSSKRRNVKIGTWVLLSSILLGFACEFSTFMNLTESMCIFGAVIAANAFLFYIYFIWEGDKNGNGACSTHYSCCNYKNAAQHKEYEPLRGAECLDNV